jgi:hypothetical protein
MVLRFDEEDKMVYVEIHLVPLVWYKRLWLGIKYIFGYQSRYGAFDEFIFNPNDARRLQKVVNFLKEENDDKRRRDKRSGSILL